MNSYTHMYYLISLRCNERCSKCSHWKVREQSSRVSTAKVIQAVLDLPDLCELCLVGGEPLIQKGTVLDILDGISNTGVKTVLVTNGVACSPRFIDTVKHFNLHIVFSIDTVDQIYWSYVRGNDSYRIVMDNFQYAVDNLHPEQISVQSVLSQETEEHVREVAEFCKRIDRFHSVQHYIQQGFEGEWTELAQKADDAPCGSCQAAWRNLSIMPDGNLFTCFQQPLMLGCEAPLGNLEEASIKQILSSPYTAKVNACMKACDLPCKVLKCNQ